MATEPIALASTDPLRAPLIGREPQLSVLSSGLDAALNGRGSLHVISGPAGMGKTRLAEWVAERAREQGARVVWGRCSETVDTPAYWPWSQVIQQTLEPLTAKEKKPTLRHGGDRHAERHG